MDKKSYARLILADREGSATFAQALQRGTVKNSGFFMLLLVSILLGCLWLWMDLPAMAGFMFGLAAGSCAFWLGQIKRYVQTRPLTEEFVDWKKVEEVADLS